MRTLLVIALLMGVSTAAMAAPQAACSLAGLDWKPDALDAERMAQPFPPRYGGEAVCDVLASSEHAIAGKLYRFTLSHVGQRQHAGERLMGDAGLLSIGRIDADSETILGRFAMPLDQLDGRDGPIDIQLAEVDGTIVASLQRSSAELFAIGAESVVRLPERSVLAAFSGLHGPEDALGRVLDVDLASKRILVAVHGSRSADPATPGSAFAPRRALLAEFAWRDGRPIIGSARLVTPHRTTALELTPDEIEEEQEARRFAGALPEGVEPCWLQAWSADKDPKGLNVRATPSANGRILGQLAPPLLDKDSGETVSAEVRIIGYKDGWFLVDKPRSNDLQEVLPGSAGIGKRWYGGRGWVSARMLGATTADSGFPAHRLYAAPSFDAQWSVARNRDGTLLSSDSPIARLHACSRDWALIDTTGGERGWRRRICSSQVTNCS